VEVHAAYWLPETNVNNFCRELIFKDLGGQLGCIDTSPRSSQSRRLKSSKTEVMAEMLGISPSMPRMNQLSNYNFIVDGGNGQEQAKARTEKMGTV
jgi:hypothetical protein